MLEVEQDSESLAIESEQAAATWAALGVREVFRLRFATHHDPIPEAADDEFTLVTVIDVVPGQLLRLSGQPLSIGQLIETEPAGDVASFENDPRVVVTAGAGHAPAIVRVLVERQAFGTSRAAARYEVTGQLSLRLTRSRRALGTLALRLLGTIPLGAQTQTELRIEGCFELDATRPLACVPGLPCATGCISADEWVCANCGELTFTHDCGCLPDLPPLQACADDAPANAGELCGERWWCDRPCAAGLTCTPDPSYDADSDAGAEGECSYRTCGPP